MISRAGKTLLVVIGILVTFAVCAPVLLGAQESQGKFEKMVPLAPGQGESMPATSLIYAAYAFVWLVLLGYVFILWRRAARVESQLIALHDRLRRKS